MDPKLIRPEATAVVTMEVQRGVLGDCPLIPALAEHAAASGVVARIVDIVEAARRARARVVHCLAVPRADRWAAPDHTPLMARLASNPAAIVAGSAGAELVAELGPDPTDGISRRQHGMSPFTGTDLDMLLRAAQVSTVVAVGASLNVGVLGLVLGAVDHGYRVVVPRDAVVGLPSDYAEAVLRHTVSHLGVVTSTSEILAAWSV